MYRIAEESWVCAKGALLEIMPTVNCVETIISLAKAADAAVYSGGCGTPIYIELPDDQDERDAIIMLARQHGLEVCVSVAHLH